MTDKYDAKARELYNLIAITGYDQISACNEISSALRSAADEERDLIQATSAKDRSPNGQLHAEHDWTRGTSWVHLKTGRTYTTVGRCRLEASGEPAVLYCGSEGTVWARAMDEFLDGRFDRLPGEASPPQSQVDRSELPSDGKLRETKTSGENP